LKTEGNDDGVTNTSHYQFRSESEASEDIVKLREQKIGNQAFWYLVKKKSKVPS